MRKTIVRAILEYFSNNRTASYPVKSPYSWVKKQKKVGYKRYYDTVHGLKRRGMVKFVKKEGIIFIELTEKGMLEKLLIKAGIEKQKDWDGKWRVCVFDIPEDAHLERDRLRALLKQYGFKKLQASVFINPYPLNRAAVAYLQETKLNAYIRFMKVEEMDYDADLKKKFGMP